jgi:hypothetical protein
VEQFGSKNKETIFFWHGEKKVYIELREGGPSQQLGEEERRGREARENQQSVRHGFIAQL